MAIERCLFGALLFAWFFCGFSAIRCQFTSYLEIQSIIEKHGINFITKDPCFKPHLQKF